MSWRYAGSLNLNHLVTASAQSDVFMLPVGGKQSPLAGDESLMQAKADLLQF
jgi:hypothetical protein